MKLPWSTSVSPSAYEATFTQRLSLRMLWIASVGAAYVLLDPYITHTFADGTTFQLGKAGGAFADQMKGAVITLILVAGFTAVKEFWLGGSAGEKAQGQTLSRMAEAAPTAPIPTATADTAVVNADTAVVQTSGDKP